MKKKDLRKALDQYGVELDKACGYSIKYQDNPTEQNMELKNYFHGRCSAIRDMIELFTGKEIVWSSETNQHELKGDK